MYAVHTHTHTHTHTKMKQQTCGWFRESAVYSSFYFIQEAETRTATPHAHTHTRTHAHTHALTHTHTHTHTHKPNYRPYNRYPVNQDLSDPSLVAPYTVVDPSFSRLTVCPVRSSRFRVTDPEGYTSEFRKKASFHAYLTPSTKRKKEPLLLFPCLLIENLKLLFGGNLDKMAIYRCLKKESSQQEQFCGCLTAKTRVTCSHAQFTGFSLENSWTHW